MHKPSDPADHSVADEGQCADLPSDVTAIEVTDTEDDAVGLYVEWDTTEWFWAEIHSYESLDEWE